MLRFSDLGLLQHAKPMHPDEVIRDVLLKGQLGSFFFLAVLDPLFELPDPGAEVWALMPDGFQSDPQRRQRPHERLRIAGQQRLHPLGGSS